MGVESWSVDEHDLLAVQLKLLGRSDSVVPSRLQTRPTGVVDELQFQSSESEIDRMDCPLYRGFSSLPTSYHTRPKGQPSRTLRDRSRTR